MADRTDAPIGALEDAFLGASLLGIELDTRYRVLAVTLEPEASRDPWGRGDRGSGDEVDRRVQVLVSPVSTVLGSLRRDPRGDAPVEVYTFTEDQMVDVAAAFGGAAVDAPLFGRPEPRPGSWAPTWSLEGRSTAGDGVTRTLTISVRTEDVAGELALDLFARFDEVLVRDASGRDLERIAPRGAFDLDALGGPPSRAPGTDGTPPSSAAST